jgi:cysteine desulfurase
MGTAMRVYLDNSATTAVDRAVLDAMIPYFGDEMGNAQSVHSFGQRAKSAIENARIQVAALLDALPAEIVFVSGGTEADNLAVRGIAEAHREHGRHIITSQIEHPAVLATCESLELAGFEVTRLPVGRDGAVRAADVEKAITPETTLVSVMHANNESGVLQPIEEIAHIVRDAKRETAPHLHFHSDAVQSVGKIRVSVQELGVDLLSLSGHKIHGPKGVGALYVRKGTRLRKLFFGGHHERDRRSGTENVPGIVGLGEAAAIAMKCLPERAARMQELRDHLEAEILARCPEVRINGVDSRRLPNISSLTFDGLDGESLLIALDLKGVAVSTGSACSSGSLEPSHVLTAMGLSREEVRGSLRLSLGAFTTREEIDYAHHIIEETVAHLRQMSPDDYVQPARGRPA